MTTRKRPVALWMLVLIPALMTACADDALEATTTSISVLPTTTQAPTTTSSVAATTTVTETSTTTAAGPTTTVPEPTTQPTVPGPSADGSGCNPGSGALPDGEWFGFVTGYDFSSTIDFDLACWFSGEAAVTAAAEDGAESPPPNDYYVRNQNNTVRTIDVTTEASIVWYANGDPTSETTGDYPGWIQILETRGPIFGIWIKTVNGKAVDIGEVWVP
jgi:cytoskeletal protein RodZ